VFDIVLYEPEIPANTGNIVRLCANTGARLHLVLPTGFTLGDRGLKRSGLDYHDLAPVTQHENWQGCLAHFSARAEPARLFALSTRASRRYDEPQFAVGDVFVFGPETRGLPQTVLEAFAPEQRLRLPMQAASRSMNLANAAAVMLYEAWRQNGFAGGA
jgi:tRNA (cytidine/uridine-2'-O-)-methyltransferase